MLLDLSVPVMTFLANSTQNDFLLFLSHDIW